MSLERGAGSERDTTTASETGEAGHDESTEAGEAADSGGGERRGRRVAARCAAGVDRCGRGDGGRVTRAGRRGVAATGTAGARRGSFGVAAGVLDVVEVSHQVGEDRVGLAVLAGVIATTRVMVVLGTVWLWYRCSSVAVNGRLPRLT